MDPKQLERFFKQSKYELYKLAYVMVPDDLQAAQIVLDSFELFLSDDLCDHQEYEATHLRKDTFLALLENVYRIGKKRFEQINHSHLFDHDSPYFPMRLEERVALFLKVAHGLTITEVSQVMNIESEKVLVLTSTAQKELWIEKNSKTLN